MARQTRPTGPAVGLQRDEKHMYRWNDGPWVPGITSIIGMLDKSTALVNWAKRETAACAVRNYKLLQDLIETGGQEAAIEWLKKIPDYMKDSAADMGTEVHNLAEKLGLGLSLPEVSDAAKNRALSYQDWVQAYKPEFLMVEYMVYSEDLLYGGTGDAIFYLSPCPAKECEGKNLRHLWMIDYKTGNNIYDTTAMQLAAARNANWIGTKGSPDKQPIPIPDHYGVLHIKDEGSWLVEYLVREEEWEAFQACRKLWTWSFFDAKNVKIKPKGYA